MNRRLFASLVALAIGGTHALALAQTSNVRIDAPKSSDVGAFELGSADRLPSAAEATPLERRTVRDHRKGRDHGSVKVRDKDSSNDGAKDDDGKGSSWKDKVKEKIKDKVQDKVQDKIDKEKEKAKDKIEKEKEKLKDRVEKEKDKLKDKVKDAVGDFF